MELDLNDWVVEAFLIKRNPKKNISIEEYFTVNKLNVNVDLKGKFKDIFKGDICDNDNNFILKLGEFYEFISDDSKEKKYKRNRS